MAPGRAGRLDEARRIGTGAEPAVHRPDPPALAGRHGPRRHPRGESLEALPEAEREAWRALWAGVDALLTRELTRRPRLL